MVSIFTGLFKATSIPFIRKHQSKFYECPNCHSVVMRVKDGNGLKHYWCTNGGSWWYRWQLKRRPKSFFMPKQYK